MSKSGMGKPSGRLGKKNSAEHNQKASESIRTNINKIKWNARKCSVLGVIYNSASEAATSIKESDCTLMYRLKSNNQKYSEYFYIDIL